MSFGLTNLQLKFLLDTLINPLKSKGASVYIFGSRATGTHREFSDIDVLFDDPSGAITDEFIFELKSELEDSDFPYKVDLVNKNHLADSYKTNVDAQKIKV